jgi:hypothetical protein
VKIREWFNKILHRRSAEPEDGERSSDAVDEAFTTSYGENTSSWIPSQQDRPRH